MSKLKLAKLIATVTPEKKHSEKPFVQVEGKLTEAQLEAIAGGQPSFLLASHPKFPVTQ